ncbi:hypothetical protein SCA6_019368, partial [Theobroma cacao]
MAENGSGGQNESADTLEGSGEYSPMIGQCASKCMHNRELSDVLSIPIVSRTNFAEIEIHPRVLRKRHVDTEISFDKIFSLTLDKAVDIGENDEASDEDSIS